MKMTKKTKKRALISSLVVIALCFTMLIGTTFAWFTDSASSTGNTITTGSLDIVFSQYDAGASDYVEITDSTAPIFGADVLWEPNATYVKYFRVENAGSLALKFNVALLVTNASANLNEVLAYNLVEGATPTNAVTAWTTGTPVALGNNATDATNIVLESGETYDFAIAVHMDKDAGNSYQNASILFNINVTATQVEFESDSFGPNYDAGADAPVVSTADEFVAALANGGEVALGADVSFDDINDVAVIITKDTVIYGNGNTLTSNAGRAINVDGTEPVKVTIKDLNIVANGERAVNVINNAHEVTLENVNATAANYAVNVATSADGAKVTVNNCDLTGLNAVNIAAPNAVININNCDIVCNDNSTVESYGAISTFTTAANTVITANGCTFTVAGDSNAAVNSCDTATIIIDGSSNVPTAVAYIMYANNYAYSFFSMEKAVEKATDADVIVLLADVTVDALAKTVNVNTNGYTLTVAGTPYTGNVTVG